MKSKTALLFGSFNPIHNGHLSIANYLLGREEIEAVMLVVSPQSPFKEEKDLVDTKHRLKMAELAITPYKGLTVCDIEFSMPKPSYTVDTLRKLHSDYPEKNYVLAIGYDNLKGFDRWRDYKEILQLAKLYVYPRGEEEITYTPKFDYTLIEAPLVNISSTNIRERISDGFDIKSMVPEEVEAYIKENKLYKTN